MENAAKNPVPLQRLGQSIPRTRVTAAGFKNFKAFAQAHPELVFVETRPGGDTWLWKAGTSPEKSASLGVRPPLLYF